MTFSVPGYEFFDWFQRDCRSNPIDDAAAAKTLLGLIMVFAIVEVVFLVLFALNSWVPRHFHQTFWWDDDGEESVEATMPSSWTNRSEGNECCREDRIRRSLRERAWSAAPDDDDKEACRECPICLHPYEEGDIVVSSEAGRCCRHVFHRKCLQRWLSNHSTCPCCREELLGAPLSRTKSLNSLGEVDDGSRIHPTPWMVDTSEFSFRDYCLFFF